VSTVVGGDGTGPAASGDRILTIPNAITVVRLCCIPVFLWLLFARDDRQNAAWLLGALGATDWVDGWIARRFDQVSELGKVLDPTADRLLFIVCVGGLIIDGAVPRWFSILVVGRELVVGGALVLLTLLGMQRFDVSWFGKAGTFALMVSFPFFCMGSSDAGWADTATFLGWLWGIPGILLSYYAAAQYVPVMRRSLVEGRARRAAGRAA
jgi:cardiolipin synthase (CMP-forming)